MREFEAPGSGRTSETSTFEKADRQYMHAYITNTTCLTHGVKAQAFKDRQYMHARRHYACACRETNKSSIKQST